MLELQKSPNWDKHCNDEYPVIKNHTYREDWPKCCPGDGTAFELIMTDGTKHTARVDFSKQYCAEGKQWRTLSGRIINRDW